VIDNATKTSLPSISNKLNFKSDELKKTKMCAVKCDAKGCGRKVVDAVSP
jgi:hypothetical protein